MHALEAECKCRLHKLTGTYRKNTGVTGTDGQTDRRTEINRYRDREATPLKRREEKKEKKEEKNVVIVTLVAPEVLLVVTKLVWYCYYNS